MQLPWATSQCCHHLTFWHEATHALHTNSPQSATSPWHRYKTSLHRDTIPLSWICYHQVLLFADELPSGELQKHTRASEAPLELTSGSTAVTAMDESLARTVQSDSSPCMLYRYSNALATVKMPPVHPGTPVSQPWNTTRANSSQPLAYICIT